jgi:hypothetical protein
MADETSASASGQPRPGFRGKCLYKTGKCNNERALKTSGQAHNLCDEHRHRQNEHQRKLDAKNRYARKDKRSSSSSKSDSPTSAMAVAAAAAAAAARGHGHRYVPYGKVRMSPTANAGVDDVHAILGRNGIVATSAMTQPMMQFHAMGLDGANAMAAAASQMVGGNGNGNGAGAMPAGQPEILPSGVVILPNGPQAPQMPYPSPMQDFDGIVVPLPSYLEGHERVEFRSRIYQKVLDFIAEECMRRFGAVAPTGSAAPQLQPAALNPAQPTTAAIATEERRDEAEINGTAAATTETKAAAGQGSATESEDSGSEKLVPESDKDGGNVAQPEDAEDDGAEEEEETPRSKRATRSRIVRKESPGSAI